MRRLWHYLKHSAGFWIVAGMVGLCLLAFASAWWEHGNVVFRHLDPLLWSLAAIAILAGVYGPLGWLIERCLRSPAPRARPPHR
jgi:hypothetical protein